MNSNWKECKLGDIAEFKNGKSRPSEIESGTIPIYGGNGILGYTDTFNYQGETVIVGRVGAYCGSVFYENKPIWVSDNALYTIPKNKTDAKFLYYLLNNMSLNSQAEGSSHPLLTQTLLNSLDVFITDSLPEQRAIAGVLSSLDDKIDLLHRQNKTLEGMAEALWRKMFVEEADPRWKKGKLGDVVKITYGKNLPTSELTESGYPVFGANGQIGCYKEYLYESPQVLISCRGEASGKVNFSCGFAFVTNNSLVLEIPINSVLKYEFVKYWALASDFTLYVTGSAQPQITIEELKMAEFDMPSEEAISHFSAIVAIYEGKRSHNNKQIANLVKLRDTLLPKLMSGEVRVSI